MWLVSDRVTEILNLILFHSFIGWKGGKNRRFSKLFAKLSNWHILIEVTLDLLEVHTIKRNNKFSPILLLATLFLRKRVVY